MLEIGEKHKAILTLMGLESYARPGELMKLRRCDLVAPLRGGLSNYSLVISPEELMRPTKVKTFNDTLELDSAWFQFLRPLLKELRGDGGEEALWSFDYPSFYRTFEQCRRELLLPKIVPYQWRHSGPSADMQSRSRTIAQVQKRGRWQTQKSVLRYERHSRLGASWNSLGDKLRSHLLRCEKHLEEVFQGSLVGCGLALANLA